VLADGTCEKCWRTKLRLSQHKKIGVTMDSDAVDHAREGLESYFRERRARGVDPDGDMKLDEQYWADVRSGRFQIPPGISPFRKHSKS
jgi:hypothetical protein